MPLEVSFHEDEDSLDFQGGGYDVAAVDSDSGDDEDEAVKEEKDGSRDRVEGGAGSAKCNVCGEEFEGREELRDHRSKHVVEGVLGEIDVKDDEGLVDGSGKKVRWLVGILVLGMSANRFYGR